MRDEAFAFQLVSMAQRWAGACNVDLRDRKNLTATVFSVTRRPEERALLAAAVELYDLVGASVPGARVMRSMGLDPDAGALLEDHELVERYTEWAEGRLTKPADSGSEG